MRIKPHLNGALLYVCQISLTFRFQPKPSHFVSLHDTFRFCDYTWNYRTSDNLIVSAAYVRLKNLQVGYTLPQRWMDKIHVSRLRVYFSGNDLFEIHNMPFNYDPEMNGSYACYPFMRYFSFGLNLNF